MAEIKEKNTDSSLNNGMQVWTLLAGIAALFLGGYYAFSGGPSEDPILLGLSANRLLLVLGFALVAVLSLYVFGKTLMGEETDWTTKLSPKVNFFTGLAAAVFSATALFFLSFPDFRLGAWVYIHAGLTPALVWLLVASTSAYVLLNIRLGQQDRALQRKSLAVFLLLLYIAVRLLHAFSIKEVAVSRDTEGYLLVPLEAPLLNRELWIGSRPFTLPLLFAVFHRDFWAVAWVQALVSIFSWAFLAWTVFRHFRSTRFALIALVSVLILSVSHLVLIWDFGMLSESLTLSLMALLVAVFFYYLHLPTWPRLAALLLVSFAWAGTRDVNAIVLLLAAVVMAAAALLERTKLAYFWAVLGLLLIFVYSSYSAFASNRDFLPNYNTLTFRTLKEEGAVEFFADHGMPLCDGELDISQPDFYEWVDREGQSTLLLYLTHRLPYSLVQPFVEDEFPVLDDFLWRKPTNYIALSPILSQEKINLHLWTGLWMAAGLFAMLESASWLRKQASVYGYLSVFVLLLALPHAFLAWHGDGFETYRHVVGASVQFELGLLMCLLFISNRYLQAGWRPNMRSLFA